MIEDIWEKRIRPETESVTYAKALNRSVTGSMNDHIHCARYLMSERVLPLSEVSQGLNDNPLSYLKHVRPKDLFHT